MALKTLFFKLGTKVFFLHFVYYVKQLFYLTLFLIKWLKKHLIFIKCFLGGKNRGG